MSVRFAGVITLAAASVGCGEVRKYHTFDGSVETGVTAEPTVPVAEVAISSVNPPFGSTAGGSEVELLGGPFGDGSTVWFGDTAAEVMDATEDWMRVRVPAAARDGVVDVTAGDAPATGGVTFRYWQDATGLVGLTGTVAFVDVVGGYWPDGGADRALVEVAWVEPVVYASWQEYTDVFGRCVSDWGSAARTVDAVDGITLVSASVRIDLTEDDGWYGANEGIEPGRSYDVELAGAPDVAFDGASVDVPSALRVTAPALGGAVPEKVARGFEVTWDTASAADYVAIVAERAMWDSAQQQWSVQQKVSCAVPDDGSFSIPGDLWSAWSDDEVVLLSVGRMRESAFTLPHNNASSAVTGAFWVAGAVRPK